MMLKIETARLQLRQFTIDDLEDLFRIYSNPEVMRYLSVRTREQTHASLLRHIKQWEEYGFGMWAVVHKINGQLIGRCGLMFLDNTPEVELGYVFAKPYWNMGLATEASKASLNYGFELLKLERIVAIAQPENVASQRVMQKVGMKYEKDAHYYNCDVVYYALSRQAWQPGDSLYILQAETLSD
jgi:ribosomal-protein-alanine N-acetyltransferase